MISQQKRGPRPASPACGGGGGRYGEALFPDHTTFSSTRLAGFSGAKLTQTPLFTPQHRSVSCNDCSVKEHIGGTASGGCSPISACNMLGLRRVVYGGVTETPVWIKGNTICFELKEVSSDLKNVFY